MSKQRLPSAGTQQPGSLPLAARNSASILEATAGDADIPIRNGADAGLLAFGWRMLTLKGAGPPSSPAKSDLKLAPPGDGERRAGPEGCRWAAPHHSGHGDQR